MTRHRLTRNLPGAEPTTAASLLAPLLAQTTTGYMAGTREVAGYKKMMRLIADSIELTKMMLVVR